MPICEGTQVLRRTELFIVYSASGAGRRITAGPARQQTGDVLNPAAWEKRGPVFQKTEQVWGVGHCSFVSRHAKPRTDRYHASPGWPRWEDRDVHAKHLRGRTMVS